MTKKVDIWPLIISYLDNSIDEESSEILNRWLDKSDENKRTLDALQRIWNSTEVNSQNFIQDQFNKEEDWKKVASRIKQMDSEEKRNRTLHFRKLRKRHQNISNLIKVAALVLVSVTSVFLTLKYAPQPADQYSEPVFNEIATNPGERANIELGDGTKVTLNVASKLTLPEKFSTQRREVELYGQAYFDVKSERNRPFYIRTENGLVEVIGTSFDVRAIPGEDDMLVAVREGTVELRRLDDDENKLVINGGYMGTISLSNGRLSVKLIDDPDIYFGWMEGRLIFKNTPIANVFAHIERWFDVTVEYDHTDHNLLSKLFTADLKTRSVNDVMKIIQISMDIDYVIEGDKVRVN